MNNKDLSQYRANRTDSNVVQTWLNEYKQMVMNDVVFKGATNTAFNQEWLDKVNGNPEVAEIVADTVIGWLNSPVGRQFISTAFGVNIPQGNDGIEKCFVDREGEVSGI